MKTVKRIFLMLLAIMMFIQDSSVARGGRGGGGRGGGGRGRGFSGGRSSGSARVSTARPSGRLVKSVPTRSSLSTAPRSTAKSSMRNSGSRHNVRSGRRGRAGGFAFRGFGRAFGLGLGCGFAYRYWYGFWLGGRWYPWANRFWGPWFPYGPYFYCGYGYFRDPAFDWVYADSVFTYPNYVAGPVIYYPAVRTTVHMPKAGKFVYVENSDGKAHGVAVYHRRKAGKHRFELERVYLAELEGGARVKIQLPRKHKNYVVLVGKMEELKPFIEQDKQGNVIDDAEETRSRKVREPLNATTFTRDDEKYFDGIRSMRDKVKDYNKISKDLDAKSQELAGKKQSKHNNDDEPDIRVKRVQVDDDDGPITIKIVG